MITEDYTATTETANLYALVLYFQNQYPDFTNCYAIKPIESKEDDQNYFEFMLTLYFASTLMTFTPRIHCLYHHLLATTQLQHGNS